MFYKTRSNPRGTSSFSPYSNKNKTHVSIGEAIVRSVEFKCSERGRANDEFTTVFSTKTQNMKLKNTAISAIKSRNNLACFWNLKAGRLSRSQSRKFLRSSCQLLPHKSPISVPKRSWYAHRNCLGAEKQCSSDKIIILTRVSVTKKTHGSHL